MRCRVPNPAYNTLMPHARPCPFACSSGGGKGALGAHAGLCMAVGAGAGDRRHRCMGDPVGLSPVEGARSASCAHRPRAWPAAGHGVAAAAADSRIAGDAVAGPAAGQSAAHPAHQPGGLLHLVAGARCRRHRARDPAQQSHRRGRQPGSAPHPDPDPSAQPGDHGRHHRARRLAGAAAVRHGGQDRFGAAGVGGPDRPGRGYRRQAGVRQPDRGPADRGDPADPPG